MRSATDIPAAIRTISEGKPVPVSVSLIWGIHEGLRGARWMVVNSDGIVTERLFLPGHDLSLPLIEKLLGRVPIQEVQALAAVLISAEFDSIQPKPDNTFWKQFHKKSK